jgi:signal transduction histidine kinase
LSARFEVPTVISVLNLFSDWKVCMHLVAVEVVAGRPASALEAAYKELQDADQLKDDLLQNLSHELRTPLTHVLGYLRLMADGALGPLNTQQVETLELVTGKAQHLAELINDIVSVQESEARNLIPKPIHIERVVALAVRSNLADAQAKDIPIVARIAANLPPVYADPVRLEEVFAELLENAVKFSPRATQIEIEIDDPGGPLIHACVRDHGIGIAPEEHERIFRRFYQVESGTTRRFAGTGLGLTIVRKIIEGHKGRVWVESEPGKGSTFVIRLPAIKPGSNPESDLEPVGMAKP